MNNQNENFNNGSKKISWISIMNAVVQAIIAALTALGVSSCKVLSFNVLHPQRCCLNFLTLLIHQKNDSRKISFIDWGGAGA